MPDPHPAAELIVAPGRKGASPITPEQRRRAGRAVARRIAEMASTPAAVARAAGIDPKTVRSLIDGEHWPSDSTQSRIEKALRWHEGEIVTRAVQGGVDGALTALTDVELAAELLRRLRARSRRGSGELRSVGRN